MLANVMDVLFGCWHKRMSFPLSSRSTKCISPAAQTTGTYVVCLDCGKEFPYDWQQMKIVSVSSEGRRASLRAEKVAQTYSRAA